jgi:hypothetical protein
VILILFPGSMLLSSLLTSNKSLLLLTSLWGPPDRRDDTRPFFSCPLWDFPVPGFAEPSREGTSGRMMKFPGPWVDNFCCICSRSETHGLSTTVSTAFRCPIVSPDIHCTTLCLVLLPSNLELGLVAAAAEVPAGLDKFNRSAHRW